MLIVYVDDILVTGDDVLEINKLSVQLSQKFDIKTLGHLRYFLGIEVARSPEGIFLSQGIFYKLPNTLAGNPVLSWTVGYCT